MNINEQIEAAWQKCRGEETYTPDYPVKASSNFADGFKYGARWALSLPLAERLTEEERNKIEVLLTIDCINVKPVRYFIGQLFGIEMFKNK